MGPNMIGGYGSWAASLAGDQPGEFSLRNPRWTDVDAWREAALARLVDRLAIPNTGGTPAASVHGHRAYDGLEIEELSWQLPYGPRTEAIFLKPAGATGRLLFSTSDPMLCRGRDPPTLACR